MSSEATIRPEPDPVVVADDPRRPQISVRRLISVTIAVIVVCLAVFFVVEDFVGHLWYQSRQNGLSGQAGLATAPAPGDKAGVLQIPSLALSVTVVEGTSPAYLRGAPGHQPGTALLTAKGNTVIVGHRSDWGAPFLHLNRLTVGQSVYAQGRSSTAPPLVYTVTRVQHLGPGDRRPYAASSDFRLTLVTDAGGRTSGSLLVVTAVSGGNAGPGRVTASTPRPLQSGSFASVPTVAFLGIAVIAGALVVALRRRYSMKVAAVVASPVLVAAALALVLAVDQVVYSPLA